MDNILFKTDEPITTKQVLTYYLNMFNDKLVANIIDLNHYIAIRIENPNYKTTNAQGLPVTVETLIIASRNGARYARRNVEYVTELLKKEATGTLAEVWSDEVVALIKSPLFDKAAEKSAEAEGDKE